MTTLYLVRHGETIDNANQILQGQTPGKLNENGIKQAQALAQELKDKHIDAFVSSDLKRAMETCEILAAPHGMTITTTPLLRERDWGGFTGMFIPDLKDKPWPSDVETLEEMKNRAQLFLQWISKNYDGKTVLAVGHGIINKTIRSVYTGKPMNEIQKMANADTIVLKVI